MQWKHIGIWNPLPERFSDGFLKRRTKEPLDESERREWKSRLKLNIQKTKIMASGPITSWQKDREAVKDFIWGGSKISADGDCNYEIKGSLLLGRQAMTNLDSILKSRDITLFGHSIMSNSLRPHGLQHARLPCPSPAPEACTNSCSLSRWRHPTVSSSSSM